jgi:hypothetical protein
MDWATFWATLSQTHLVILLSPEMVGATVNTLRIPMGFSTLLEMPVQRSEHFVHMVVSYIHMCIPPFCSTYTESPFFFAMCVTCVFVASFFSVSLCLCFSFFHYSSQCNFLFFWCLYSTFCFCNVFLLFFYVSVFYL